MHPITACLAVSLGAALVHSHSRQRCLSSEFCENQTPVADLVYVDEEGQWAIGSDYADVIAEIDVCEGGITVNYPSAQNGSMLSNVLRVTGAIQGVEESGAGEWEAGTYTIHLGLRGDALTYFTEDLEALDHVGGITIRSFVKLAAVNSLVTNFDVAVTYEVSGEWSFANTDGIVAQSASLSVYLESTSDPDTDSFCGESPFTVKTPAFTHSMNENFTSGSPSYFDSGSTELEGFDTTVDLIVALNLTIHLVPGEVQSDEGPDAALDDDFVWTVNLKAIAP